MKNVLSFILLLIGLKAGAQEIGPKWIILEKTNQVGVIKPGANDLMIYMMGKMKAMDKAAFADLNNSLNFKAGSVVLVTGHTGSDYIATDIEGRTLVIKGKVTDAEQKANSGVGYLKKTVSAGGIELEQGTYVWLKNIDTKSSMATIQFSGNKNPKVPLDDLYLIDKTTGEMAAGISFKAVE